MRGSVEVIHSKANPCLRRVGAVRAGKQAALLLEGERLVADALAGGHTLDLLLVRADRPELLTRFPAREARLVDPHALKGVSSLKSPPPVLALAPSPPPRGVEELVPGPDALWLIACGLADPGNLGALARSAEAAGAEALVLLGRGVDPFGPRALRGSMGSLLRLPLARAEEAASLRDHLERNAFRSVTAATRGGKEPALFDWSGRVALWIGAETGALPEAARSFEGVTIPMAGGVESLNVTVAASLLLFAAGRNR